MDRTLVFVVVTTAALSCSDVQDFHGAGTDAQRAEPAPTAGPSTPPVAMPMPAPPPCGPGECEAIILAHDQGLDPEHPDAQGVYAIVTDEAWVYWMTAFSELVRARKDGGPAEKLADTESAPQVLRLAGNYLYFTNVLQRQIVRMRKAGGALETVMAAPSTDWQNYVQDFVVDGERLTWIDARRVLRCPSVPCTKSEELMPTGTLHPLALATTREHVFVPYLLEQANSNSLLPGGIYVPTGAGQVFTLPLDYRTVRAEPRPATAAGPSLTDVYAGSRNVILRAAFPGDEPTTVLASGADVGEFPAGLSLDATYVYWVLRGNTCTTCAPGETVENGRLMRVKKDGSSLPEVVYRADAMLHDAALTADAIYLTTGAGTVLKLPKPADRPPH